MGPSGWRSTTLAEIAAKPTGLQTGPFGSQLKASEYTPEGIPVVMPKDMVGGRVVTRDIARVPEEVARRLSHHRIRAGDILFGRRGELGRCALIEPKQEGWLCGTGCLRFRPDGTTAAEFLSQVFGSIQISSWLTENAVGQTMLNLNTEILGRLPLSIPPLPEQRKIAAILSSVDDTIERTQAVIDQLEVVKKGLLAELLTRGMPGRHKEFVPLPDEWRLGRIGSTSSMPKGWDLIRLTDVARLESGHTPSRRHPEYWDGGVPWVSLHDSKGLDVPVLLDTAQHIAPLGLENSSARLLPAGTVVFSRTATIGKATILGKEMATSQDFANYICGERLGNRYLMHYFRANAGEWERLKAGSTHKTLYMPIFEQLQVLLPPREEQDLIAEVADATDRRIAAEGRALNGLVVLKEALLDALLSGRVRVPISAQEAA